MPGIKKITLIRAGRRLPWGYFSQPLGLLYLASALRRAFPGVEIELVEQALHRLGGAEIRERLLRSRPDIVGISCLSLEAPELHRAARAAKEALPGVTVAAGGPHAHFFWKEILADPAVDFCVLGEGEETFAGLVRAVGSGVSPAAVPGLAFRGPGGPETSPPRPPAEDLDSLPLPAWDLVDFGRYARERSMNGYTARRPWAVVSTSRGCPYDCAYCHGMFGRRARLRSPENVLAELELLVKRHGVREIQFVDDIFNIDLPRAKRICELIIERGLDVAISFPNGLRADLMDRELLRLLRRAGCYSVTYAVETASPRLQREIGKGLDLGKAAEAVRWTAEEGIIPHGFFMLGFPGETREELEATGRWALESGVELPIFFMVVVYPGTRLHEMAKAAYPGLDLSKVDPSSLDYRHWEPFYSRASGFDLHRYFVSLTRRGYLKFGRAMLRRLPFPSNLLFAAGLFFRALPRVWGPAGAVERLFLGRPEPLPPAPSGAQREVL